MSSQFRLGLDVVLGKLFASVHIGISASCRAAPESIQKKTHEMLLIYKNPAHAAP